MILQALAKLYDDLRQQNDRVPVYGYSSVAVSAIVAIDKEGNLIDIVPAASDENKMAEMIVPIHFKRQGIIPRPYYLCDAFPYVFGIEPDGKKYKNNEEKEHAELKAKEKRIAFCQKHQELLKPIVVSEAQAFLSFLDKWKPSDSKNRAMLNSAASFATKGSLVFRCVETGRFIHDVPEIQKAVLTALMDEEEDLYGTCLVTGEYCKISRTHNSVKGIYSPSIAPNGWTLVSFDKDSLAFSSFGKIQGENAPVSKKIEFAYTTALNYLLSDRERVNHIGDTTVVCWADGAKPQYRALSSASLFGQAPPAGMTEDELRAAVKRLANGLPCPEYDLSPDTVFYILGLAPNAARISVRFFYRNSFGALMKNVNDHYERLRIEGERSDTLPLWALLRETVNPSASDKTPSPVLSGAVTRAVLEGTRYPAALLEAVTLRIRAERDIKSAKAAIIKAYYLKNQNPKVPKEVLTVSLNESSTNIPYTLGRLFAVYEAAQERANPGISATIRDKYFNAAAATPAHIFPVLNNLYQHHIRKMDAKYRVFFDKQVGDLTGNLEETLPNRLGLPEQGAFQLGYYHQKQKRFEKKENN